MTYDDFEPLYERWIGGGPGGFVKRFLYSILLGVFVLGLHFLVIEDQLFDNYGWILFLIIIVASFSLFFATHTFKRLFPQLNNHLTDTQKEAFLSDVDNYLSDKVFLSYGVLFGALNSLIGIVFGIPDLYETILDQSVLMLGYFLAGFVCGLALSGIVGVTRTLSNLFLSEHSFLDYTSHDKCGGTQFVGRALLIFSIVTLAVGLLIASYISYTSWAQKESILVNVIYFSWIALPYVASVFVLLIPAISINKLLTKYKISQDEKLSNQIAGIFQELETEGISGERKRELYADYEFQTQMRATLHQMRTWPFGIGTNSTYFLSVGASLFGTVTNIQSWVPATPA